MRVSFTEHPAAVGETYFEHLGQASSFGLAMLRAGFACLVHGFFPFLCVRTGSTTINHLHHKMVVNRHRQPLTDPEGLMRGSAI